MWPVTAFFIETWPVTAFFLVNLACYIVFIGIWPVTAFFLLECGMLQRFF